MAGLKRTSQRLEVPIDPSTFVQYLASAAEVAVGEEDSWSSTLENQVVLAAVDFLENATGLSLWESTWRLTLDEWPEDDIIRLPKPPVTGVTSITYIDSDGELQTIDEDDYYVSLASTVPTIRPADSWPTAKSRPDAITIVFTAGPYIDTDSPSEAAELASDLRMAILAMYAEMLVNRGASSEMRMAELPFGVRETIHRHKVDW